MKRMIGLLMVMVVGLWSGVWGEEIKTHTEKYDKSFPFFRSPVKEVYQLIRDGQYTSFYRNGNHHEMNEDLKQTRNEWKICNELYS